MLKVEGNPNIDLSAVQDPNVRYKVEWVRIDDPDATLPDDHGPVRGAPPDHHQRPGPGPRGLAGLGKGVGPLQPARGRGLRRQGHLLLLDPGRRGARGSRHLHAAGDGLRQGQRADLGLQHSHETLKPVYQSTGGQPQVPPNLPPEVLDFPDNVTTTKKGTIILCEDNTNLNFVRGLTRKGELFDLALNQIMTPSNRTGRRVRRGHLQPRLLDALRQHPGQQRHELRHLGSLAQGLTPTGNPSVAWLASVARPRRWITIEPWRSGRPRPACPPPWGST